MLMLKKDHFIVVRFIEIVLRWFYNCLKNVSWGALLSNWNHDVINPICVFIIYMYKEHIRQTYIWLFIDVLTRVRISTYHPSYAGVYRSDRPVTYTVCHFHFEGATFDSGKVPRRATFILWWIRTLFLSIQFTFIILCTWINLCQFQFVSSNIVAQDFKIKWLLFRFETLLINSWFIRFWLRYILIGKFYMKHHI